MALAKTTSGTSQERRAYGYSPSTSRFVELLNHMHQVGNLLHIVVKAQKAQTLKENE